MLGAFVGERAGLAVALAFQRLALAGERDPLGGRDLDLLDLLDPLSEPDELVVLAGLDGEAAQVALLDREPAVGLLVGLAGFGQPGARFAELVERVLLARELQDAPEQLLGGALDRLVGLPLLDGDHATQRARDTGAREQFVPCARLVPLVDGHACAQLVMSASRPRPPAPHSCAPGRIA